MKQDETRYETEYHVASNQCATAADWLDEIITLTQRTQQETVGYSVILTFGYSYIGLG